MAVIEFRTLGSLQLRRSDGPELHSLLAQPKRLALLAYLCIAKPRGFHRRDTLLGLFWPDADQTHARTSLRNALYVLRHSLGETAFHSRGDEEIGVNFDAINCDAVAFEEQIDSGSVEGAIELYRGDLLAGFFLEDVPAFERWLESERSRLRGYASSAANRASDRRESQGDLREALRWARRAVELTNTDEPAVRRVIELLTRVGDRAGALQAYDKLAKHLAAEFEAEPSPETRGLVERLRANQFLAPSTGTQRQRVDVLGEPIQSEVVNLQSSDEPPITIDRRTSIARSRVATASVIGLALVIATLSIARAFYGKARPHPEVRQKLTTTGNTMMASLSPDGQFLAYVTQAGDSQRVVVQDMTSGAANTIGTMSGAIWSIEWTPDGGRVLVGGSRRAIVLPRLGGPLTMIGPQVAGQAMVYPLPDTSRLSIHDAHDRQILVFDQRSQDTLRIPIKGSYTWLFEGSWSPTGRVFAVVTESGDPLSWEIRAVSLDGRNELVVRDTILLASPRWSPDGSKLYFARGTEAVWGVSVSPMTGAPQGPPEEIVKNLEMLSQRFGLVHFALTSNGKGLVYSRGARFSNLWLLERSAGDAPPRATALTTGTSLRWSPVVSPDGTSIAFAQETGGSGELFTMPINGGSPIPITTGARVRRESQIAWSPDGSLIAFGSVRKGHAQVWVATVADGRMRSFDRTRTSTATSHLTWAPGSEIAYQTTNQSINAIDPGSGDERTVIQDPTGAVHSPTYSPDGSQLGVSRYHPGKQPWEILVVDVRHSSSIRVGEGAYARGWSPDSRFIYYQWPQSPIVYRLDSRGQGKGEIFLKPPFRAAECRPVGASRPNAFLCVAFDFASDIWRIDNFDRQSN